MYFISSLFCNIKVHSLFFYSLKESLEIFVSKKIRKKFIVFISVKSMYESKFLEAIFSFIRSYVCLNYLLRVWSNSCVTTCRWRIYRVSRFNIEKLFINFNVESYRIVENESFNENNCLKKKKHRITIQ